MNIIERQFTQVDPAEPHRSLLRIPEARDQVGDRGLAGTARADEGEDGTLLQLDRDIVQHGPACLIGKRDVPEGNVVARMVGDSRGGRVLYLDGGTPTTVGTAYRAAGPSTP